MTHKESIKLKEQIQFNTFSRNTIEKEISANYIPKFLDQNDSCELGAKPPKVRTSKRK